MITHNPSAKLAGMNTDPPQTSGQVLRARMDELGVTKTDLSTASGVSRNTINSALADDPKTRPATYDNLFRVLVELDADRAERDRRASSEDVGLFTISMRGVFGVESVTFSGPPEDVDAVRHAAADFVKQVREGLTDDD